MPKAKNKIEKKVCYQANFVKGVNHGCKVHCYIHRYALPKLENVESIYPENTEPVNSCQLHIPASWVTQTINGKRVTENQVTWVRVD